MTAPVGPRRVFITGIGRGLGFAIADSFRSAGDLVYGSTRSGTSPLDVEECVALDLADEASIMAAAAKVSTEIDSLDLLINCAGVDAREFGGHEEHRGAFDLDAKTFNAVINVNVTGPMVLTRELRPLLQAAESAMIINISSQLGSMQVAARKGRDAVYCVSKAALNMLSVKSAAELASDKIGVVMMHPGWVQTDMGGVSAPLPLADAANSIHATINALTFEDSGRFIRWDGHDHPW